MPRSSFNCLELQRGFASCAKNQIGAVAENNAPKWCNAITRANIPPPMVRAITV